MRDEVEEHEAATFGFGVFSFVRFTILITPACPFEFPAMSKVNFFSLEIRWQPQPQLIAEVGGTRRIPFFRVGSDECFVLILNPIKVAILRHASVFQLAGEVEGGYEVFNHDTQIVRHQIGSD